MIPFICQTLRAPLTDEQIAAIEADGENGMNYCCYDAASRGPGGCSCWIPEYSTRRRKPLGGTVVERDKPCADCAYSHGSAEQQSAFDSENLSHIAASGDGVFFCHQGIAYVVRWRHPLGMVVEAELDAAGAVNTYEPRYATAALNGNLTSVPAKANGKPADICAGYAARRRLTLETS